MNHPAHSVARGGAGYLRRMIDGERRPEQNPGDYDPEEDPDTDPPAGGEGDELTPGAGDDEDDDRDDRSGS
jgi:hypothetical protein